MPHDFIIGPHGKKIEVKSAQKGRVQRIVPGKLVYVEIKPAQDRYVFKPNKVVIKKKTGP